MNNIFKENDYAKRTGAFENDPSADQGLGRVPESNAGDYAVRRVSGKQ